MSDSTPDFGKLTEAFNKHVLQPALEASKEKLNQLLDTVPTSFISQSLEDVYALLTNLDASSTLGAALDTSKIADAVDNLKYKLQDPEVSKKLALGIKGLLSQTSTESIEKLLTDAALEASPADQLTIQVILSQLGPTIDSLKNASVEDIAYQLNVIADNLSGNFVASQLSALIQEAPQKFSQQARDLVSQLPAPGAVAGLVQDLGNAAREALDNATSGTSFAETLGALKKFSENATTILSQALGQETPATYPVEKQKPAKKSPSAKKGKGGKKYNL